MILNFIILIVLLNIVVIHGYSNKYLSIRIKKQYKNDKNRLNKETALNEVAEWLRGKDIDGADEIEMINVRFINTLQGKDVIAVVPAGANLLAVGDENGVKLPRACRTGLCGSCTAEVQDPEAIKTDSNPREGFATIRACSSKCFVPQGMTEMVVDVQRMKNRAIAQANAKEGKRGGLKTLNNLEDDYVDPMARFTGNWEKEFRPQWELAKEKGVGQVGGASNPKASGQKCSKCSGTGRSTCYCCNGVGKVMMGSSGSAGGRGETQCSVCVGMRTVGCAYCQGKGSGGKKG